MTQGTLQGVVVRRGRKPSLTLELAMAICAGRRDGLSLSAAAAEHYVYPQLVFWWKRRGEELDMREDIEFDQLDEQDQIYVLFARGLLKAMAACEREWVGYWREAGKGDWRSAMKFLEHYDPATWSTRTVLMTRVQELELALLESYQERWADKQGSGGERTWSTDDRIAAVAAIMVETGLLDTHFEPIAAALRSRGMIVQLPSRKAQPQVPAQNATAAHQEPPPPRYHCERGVHTPKKDDRRHCENPACGAYAVHGFNPPPWGPQLG